MKTHVFLIGSKGLPARYGGFETFVENLTAGRISQEICYHVSCMANDECHFVYNGIDCFKVKLPLPGPIGRMLHVSRVLRKIEAWRRTNAEEAAIVYILGCRVGPFLNSHAKRLKQLNVKVFSNPDGLEWKRGKWSALWKVFLKYCEKCLVCCSDMLICDSQSIEKYIRETYAAASPRTTYIAYGAEVEPSMCDEGVLQEWYGRYKLKKQGYYLVVARFVPENSFEFIIREFMESDTNRDLVLVTNIEHNKFYDRLKRKTAFENDPRIKFVGTVYDRELIKKIREEAFAYVHGHEVGGTNPSLLEALASTNVNLLLDVGFNREVAEGAALYWGKIPGSLVTTIQNVDAMPSAAREELGKKAKDRIRGRFNWPAICAAYEEVWRNETMG